MNGRLSNIRTNLIGSSRISLKSAVKLGKPFQSSTLGHRVGWCDINEMHFSVKTDSSDLSKHLLSPLTTIALLVISILKLVHTTAILLRPATNALSCSKNRKFPSKCNALNQLLVPAESLQCEQAFKALSRKVDCLEFCNCAKEIKINRRVNEMILFAKPFQIF